MKNEAKGDQIGRGLKIYSKLSDGYVVNKAEEAELYGVNERKYPAGYRLETLYKIRLQNSAVLALCKILQFLSDGIYTG